MVEAIVGLPENLFQNNSIPSAVLVLNTDRPTEREGEVQFFTPPTRNCRTRTNSPRRVLATS
jgi:type I restriction-modification system DNA methylase subunit